ncbi:MAG TPA: SpoIIE family protein phosphatase [Vicinamibacterales bacterium]|nr:SpoIIE family protein phosphatase [Vicinamibacterales bacterium]
MDPTPHTSPRLGSQDAVVLVATPGRRREAVGSPRPVMSPPMYVGDFVQAAAATRPCRAIGGDFFDYLDTGLEFHVLLGDAWGSGTPAALQAALIQGILAGDVERGTGAARLVSQLNQALCRRRMGDRYVTLFYAVITRDRRFTYCNAGHYPPMLFRDSKVRRLGAGGLPPGLVDDARYEEESLFVEPGDTLVVFSDGLARASNGTGKFGVARIQQIVSAHRGRTPATIVERLMGSVREFTDGSRQRDDITAFVARYSGEARRDHGYHPAPA